jgi:hypothetical protein
MSLREDSTEKAAKQLYNEYVNESDIHSNRHPSWEELPDSQRERWRKSAPLTPHLCDRADGVRGHYAVGRMRPDGYYEYWNTRIQAWAAFSAEVLLIGEARKMRDKLAKEVDYERSKHQQYGPIGW